jgi:hypothetical protein
VTRLSRRGRWCRPGVYQAFGDRLDAEVQSFQGPGAEQDQIARFAEYDFVGCAFAGHGDEHAAGPTFENGSVGLAKEPFVIALDAERFEHLGRSPR